MARRKRRVKRRRSSGNLTLRRVRGQVYRRNPGGGILAGVKQQVMDALATTGGGAAARFVSAVVPLPDAGLTGVVKGIAVAAAVGMAARRFLPADVARFVAAGAMQVPVKNLITTFAPGAGAFLGNYDVVQGTSYQDELGGYVEPQADEEQMGAYVESF